MKLNVKKKVSEEKRDTSVECYKFKNIDLEEVIYPFFLSQIYIGKRKY